MVYCSSGAGEGRGSVPGLKEAGLDIVTLREVIKVHRKRNGLLR